MNAQELSVKSLKLAENDLTARTEQRLDANRQTCALLKVRVRDEITKAEGNVVGNLIDNGGEKWIYFTNGTKQTNLLFRNYYPLSIYFPDYGIASLRSNCTYILTISGEVAYQPSAQQAIETGKNYLVLNVAPQNTVVTIDNQIQSVNPDGSYMLYLPYGNHTYSLMAGGYEKRTGTFTITATDKTVLSITLPSVLATLSVSSATHDASILVNSDHKGTGSWTGELPAGDYLVEVKMEGYRPYSQSVTLVEKERRDLRVPALTEITGGLNVSYSPAMCEIKLDGRKLGTTPGIFTNIPVGNHTLEISKDGYNVSRMTVTVREGQLTEVKGNLEKDNSVITMGNSASSQMSLVRDLAKKAASDNPMDLVSVLEQIEPALTNPECAKDVLTWYTAGKAAFGLYDQLYKLKLLGQPVEDEMMNEALSAGFEFYQKALPLDTIVEVDKKTGAPMLNSDGTKKVKTKYSKEIIGALTSHMGDIANAGNVYLQNSDWANAAAAFGNYADLARSAFAIANGLAAPDSTLSQVRFFQGYSQYQIQDFANAYDSFTKARKLGYTDNNIVDFQTSALANMVQGTLDKNQYDEANSLIDNALKSDPMNGTLHDIKGFTIELQKGVDAALPFYRKAVEVDPTYANAYFDVGRCLYLQAQKIIDDNPNATNKELVPKIKPIYDEAIPYLEKATQLNPDDNKAKNVLDDILYKFEVMGVK